MIHIYIYIFDIILQFAKWQMRVFVEFDFIQDIYLYVFI